MHHGISYNLSYTIGGGEEWIAILSPDKREACCNCHFDCRRAIVQYTIAGIDFFSQRTTHLAIQPFSPGGIDNCRNSVFAAIANRQLDNFASWHYAVYALGCHLRYLP